MPIEFEQKIITSGYDRKTCWVHPRAGAIPVKSKPPIAVLMMFKLRISGDDVFSPTEDMRSDDGGETWSSPTPHPGAFERRKLGDNIMEGVCDWWPAWHAESEKLLAIGHTVRYVNDNIPFGPRQRQTAYSVYNIEKRSWSQWKTLNTACFGDFPMEGAGCVQRLDLPDGKILLPTYYTFPDKFGDEPHGVDCQWNTSVMKCSFDCKNLKYIEHGNELKIDGDYGFVEPSLIDFKGQYYLTLRNNKEGYVATSADGLDYDVPKRWTFDDGSLLGNINTQTHWVKMPNELYLVYTRKAENNENIPRYRAPLFIAKVDTDRICLLRNTEKILVPNRGARLGNFGVTKINEKESWVTVAEWMQTNGPEYWDVSQCEKYGSNNSIFLIKIRDIND